MIDKEREELAEVIGKGLASGSKISAEDLQNENTISYKMGEIMEMDADFVTLLNFVDWYSPTKEVNEKLTKMLRHIAKQTYQNQTKIVELEKENAELKSENQKWKDEWQEQVQKAADEGYARTLQTMQLNKAKQFIRDFLSVAIDYIDPIDKHYSLIAEAEQFLKDLEK